MISIDETQIKTVCDYVGENEEVVVAMEECSELIQAISKSLRSNGYATTEENSDSKAITDHVAEEIADVLICIEHLKYIYGINDGAIQSWVNYKQRRALTLVANEKKRREELYFGAGDKNK